MQQKVNSFQYWTVNSDFSAWILICRFKMSNSQILFEKKMLSTIPFLQNWSDIQIKSWTFVRYQIFIHNFQNKKHTFESHANWDDRLLENSLNQHRLNSCVCTHFIASYKLFLAYLKSSLPCDERWKTLSLRSY